MFDSSSIDQSPDLKDLKSTGTSFFMKSPGRNMKPTWGNRIVKDFNDLDYEVDAHMFKAKQQFVNSQTQRQKKVKVDLNKRRESKKNTIRARKSNKSHVKYFNEERQNPQVIQIGVAQSAGSKTLGLSTFQYQNTIEGKMHKRLNHHISFSKNNVNRSINLNEIYYQKDNDIDFSFVRMIQRRKDLKTFHQFKSYTDRRVFEGNDSLDKFYNISSALKRCSPTKIKETILPFEVVSARKNDKIKEASLLSYDTILGNLKIKNKSISYGVPTAPRSFKIGSQVINDKRGCNR